MVDLDRFMGDGMGTKINRLIKSMQIITEQVQTDSLGVDIENSIAFPLHSLGGSNYTYNYTALLVSGQLTNAGATSSYPQLLVEFFPHFIKTKQQGVTSGTITINKVVPENTILLAGGVNMRYTSSGSYNYASGRGVLNGDSEIAVSINGMAESGARQVNPQCNIGWVCLEFVGGVL